MKEELAMVIEPKLSTAPPPDSSPELLRAFETKEQLDAVMLPSLSIAPPYVLSPPTIELETNVQLSRVNWPKD